MNTIRKVATLALGAAVLWTAAGCASSTPSADPSGGADDMASLVSAAQDEGELTFYGDANETSLQKWTQGFTDKYGIPVNVLRMPGSELTQRFQQEQAAGQSQADIFSVADRVSMEKMVSAGYIAEYTPANADLYPAEQSKAGYYYPLQNGYFQTIAYNTSKVSADDIAKIQSDPIKAAGDPKFKGKLGVNMPQSSQQIAALYYDWAEGDASSTYGWAALEAMAANKPLIQSSATLVQSLVQGEVSVAVGITDSLEFSYVAQGAPIQFVYPNPTVGGYFSDAIVKSAPHPNAAKLFMEWATTPEADQLYTQITNTAPVNSQVKDERDIVKEDWYSAPDTSTVWFDFINDKDFLTASDAKGDFLKKWNNVFGYNG
nr:extracellular solute-binding protein [Microbacterium bovistercoris]